MGLRSPRLRGPLGRLAAAVLLGTSALTGCDLSGNVVTDLGPTGGTPVEGGTATMALPPAATPNWIFPIGAPATWPRTTAPSRACCSCRCTHPSRRVPR